MEAEKTKAALSKEAMAQKMVEGTIVLFLPVTTNSVNRKEVG